MAAGIAGARGEFTRSRVLKLRYFRQNSLAASVFAGDVSKSPPTDPASVEAMIGFTVRRFVNEPTTAVLLPGLS